MTMTLRDARIQPVADNRAQYRPALDAVMLGHCPGSVNWRWLLDSNSITSEMAAVGYAGELALLGKLRDAQEVAENIDIHALMALHRLPIPLTSLSQFNALFVEAGNSSTEYQSRLAGNRAWLPGAVRDFFLGAQAGENRRLWIIVVDQEDQQEGFLPHPDTDWLNGNLYGAFDRALGLPDIGLIALPDLERLQVPAELADIPPLQLHHPAPGFLPCDVQYDESHIEVQNAVGVPRQSRPRDFIDLLHPLLDCISAKRPDIHLLFSMPFDADEENEQPQLSVQAQQQLAQYRNGRHAARLRHVQLLFPYLRSVSNKLISGCGVLAAEMVRQTAQVGAWHSVAGRPLSESYRPYPRLASQKTTSLREQQAIGVLVEQSGYLQLDDERLAAGVFNDKNAQSHSGEIARFLGWLQRELRHLGEQLVFDTDPQDPRPLIALETFFGKLHERGALRGLLANQAFSIRQSTPDESQLLFEIDIAPAFPIDRIRFLITQDQLDSSWALEMSHV